MCCRLIIIWLLLLIFSLWVGLFSYSEWVKVRYCGQLWLLLWCVVMLVLGVCCGLISEWLKFIVFSFGFSRLSRVVLEFSVVLVLVLSCCGVMLLLRNSSRFLCFCLVSMWLRLLGIVRWLEVIMISVFFLYGLVWICLISCEIRWLVYLSVLSRLMLLYLFWQCLFLYDIGRCLVGWWVFMVSVVSMNGELVCESCLKCWQVVFSSMLLCMFQVEQWMWLIFFCCLNYVRLCILLKLWLVRNCFLLVNWLLVLFR